MDSVSKSAESTISSNLEGEEFSYGQLLGILLRRWPWIIGALAISLLFAAYKASQQKPVYRSSMQLIVEPNFREQLSASDLAPYQEQSGSETDYATQLNLMRSGQFLEEAVARLENEYPGLDAQTVAAGFNLQRLAEDDAATRIFQASYTAGDPELTQRFLEELKWVYLQYNQDRQQERLTQGLDNINQQLASTQISLQRSQNELQQFRQNADLIDPTEQASNVAQSLAQLQTERRQLDANISEVATQYQVLEQKLALTPSNALLASRLSQSSQVQGLLNTLQETELALAEQRSVFTDADPSVRLLLEQRRNQIQVLQDTLGNIIRQPVEELDPELVSYLQLGSVDIALVSELLAANTALQSLNARRASLETQETNLQVALDAYPGLIAEYDRLQPEVEIERATLERLLQEREQVMAQLSREGFTWQVVEAPTYGQQLGPDRLRTILLGGIVGIFLGGLLAFVREVSDTVIHTSDDLERQVSLPLLGTLPWLGQHEGRRSPRNQLKSLFSSVAHSETSSSPLIQPILQPVFRESMDVIGNALQLHHRNERKVLAVTSALPGEGKTTVTLGLAYTLARMNQRVLIVDADLRCSGLREHLRLDQRENLANALGTGREPQAVQRVYLEPVEFDVLPAGPSPTDPLLLLSSSEFGRFLKKYREIYDIVLVDTPPVLGMADAVRVGGECDGIILVTRLDKITQSELNDAVVALSSFDVLGIIANGGKVAAVRYKNYESQASDLAAVAYQTS